MIDHLIRFNSEAEAKADPVVGQYRSEEGGWRGDCCFPGQQVWRPEDDTVVEGDIAHHPLPYWYITISLSNVELVHSPFTLEQLGEFRLSSVPSGRNYPYR